MGKKSRSGVLSLHVIASFLPIHWWYQSMMQNIGASCSGSMECWRIVSFSYEQRFWMEQKRNELNEKARSESKETKETKESFEWISRREKFHASCQPTATLSCIHTDSIQRMINFFTRYNARVLIRCNFFACVSATSVVSLHLGNPAFGMHLFWHVHTRRKVCLCMRVHNETTTKMVTILNFECMLNAEAAAAAASTAKISPNSFQIYVTAEFDLFHGNCLDIYRCWWGHLRSM